MDMCSSDGPCSILLDWIIGYFQVIVWPDLTTCKSPIVPIIKQLPKLGMDPNGQARGPPDRQLGALAEGASIQPGLLPSQILTTLTQTNALPASWPNE